MSVNDVFERPWGMHTAAVSVFTDVYDPVGYRAAVCSVGILIKLTCTKLDKTYGLSVGVYDPAAPNLLSFRALIAASMLAGSRALMVSFTWHRPLGTHK